MLSGDREHCDGYAHRIGERSGRVARVDVELWRGRYRIDAVACKARGAAVVIRRHEHAEQQLRLGDRHGQRDTTVASARLAERAEDAAALFDDSACYAIDDSPALRLQPGRRPIVVRGCSHGVGCLSLGWGSGGGYGRVVPNCDPHAPDADVCAGCVVRVDGELVGWKRGEHNDHLSDEVTGADGEIDLIAIAQPGRRIDE